MIQLFDYAKVLTERALRVDGTINRLANLPPYWRMASTCSGTGTFEMACDEVAKALSSVLPEETPHAFKVA